MPHLTFDIESSGPMIDVFIGVSLPYLQAIQQAGATAPPPLVRARALIDTGASGCCIDPDIVAQLPIKPSSSMLVHTPSTQGVPQSQPVYDIGIYLPHTTANYTFTRSLPAMCCHLKSSGIDMLIGRDILANCLLVYDGAANRYSIAF